MECGNCGRRTWTGRGICEGCMRFRYHQERVILTPKGQAWVARAKRAPPTLDP